MIQANFKRNLQKNYMILSGEKHTSNNYQLSMIRENDIKGLLNMEIRFIDNTVQYYYDISGKQTVRSIFEKRKITYNDLKVMLLELHSILQQTKSYLLDEVHIVVEPEYLYCNFECTKLELLFYIDYESEERNIFTKLAEYLIEQIDHEDEDAVSVAYKFYQSIRKENFILEEFLTIIQEKNKEIVESIKEESIEIVENSKEVEIVDDQLKDATIIEEVIENKSSKNQGSILLFDKKIPFLYMIKVLGVASIFLVGSICVGAKFPFYKTEKFLLFAVGIIIMIVGIIHYLVKREKKEELGLPPITKRDTSKDKFETIIPKKSVTYETCRTIMEEIKGAPFASKGEKRSEHTIFMGKVGVEQRILKGRINHTEIVYAIKTMPCIIGKADGNADIVISHDSISRIHARITERENRLYIEDLNSTNGTYKNGIVLETNEEIMLEVKDEIQIGSIYLEYR